MSHLMVDQARFNMIEQQIRPWGVLDDRILDLLCQVRREEFVIPEYRNLAFVDTQLPIADNQYMLEPKVEARMLQELQQGCERIAVIGAGTGYLAALTSKLVQWVDAFEIKSTIANLAINNLQHNQISSVNIITDDGLARLEQATVNYDAIVLTGSIPSVSPSLLHALTPGGIMLAFVGQSPSTSALRIDVHGSTHTLFDTNQPFLDLSAYPQKEEFIL